MRRRTQAALFFGGAVGLSSIGYALAPPAHSLPIMLHTGAGGFTNAHCLPSGAWAATLSITGTNLDLHPKATIAVAGQPPMKPVAVPYSHDFTAPASAATLSASAHIVWDDGVTQDVGPYSASRPDGCTPPTTAVGVTTTTTCTQAIPPRDNCEVTTSTTTSTTIPPPPSSNPTASPPSAVPASGEAPPISMVRSPNASPTSTTKTAIALPTTGTSETAAIVAGIGALLIGGVLLLAGRRGES